MLCSICFRYWHILIKFNVLELCSSSVSKGYVTYCHHFTFIFVFRKLGHISTFFSETIGTVAPNLGRNIIVWSATNCMCSVTISNLRWTSPRNGHSFNIRPYRKKILKNKYSLKPMNHLKTNMAGMLHGWYFKSICIQNGRIDMMKF